MDVLIEPDVDVVVALEGGWQVPAVVMAVSDNCVDLRMVSDALEPAALPGGLTECEARITWETRLGTAAREGTITVSADGLLRLDASSSEQSLQRRGHVRVPADLVAAIVGEDSRVVTRTLDISVGGMLLSPVDSIVPDQHVRFAIGLGDITVTGNGEVVRETPDGAPAVRFVGLHDLAERELAAFVDQRRRELAAPASSIAV